MYYSIKLAVAPSLTAVNPKELFHISTSGWIYNGWIKKGLMGKWLDLACAAYLTPSADG